MVEYISNTYSHIIIFNNNQGDFNGVFLANHSKIIFGDNVYLNFSNNIGKNGGAFFLDSNSTILLFSMLANLVYLYILSIIQHTREGQSLLKMLFRVGHFQLWSNII